MTDFHDYDEELVDGEGSAEEGIEESIFGTGPSVPSAEKELIASKVAAIEASRYDNLPKATQAYMDTLARMDRFELDMIKAERTRAEMVQREELLVDTAIADHQAGKDITDMAAVLASYTGAKEQEYRNQIIEEQFYEEMTARAAANPNNVQLYRALLDTSERGHAVARYYESARRHNMMRNYIMEKQADSAEQGWFHSLTEFFSNLATGKQYHMLLNVDEQEDVGVTALDDLVAAIVTGNPSEVIHRIRDKFDGIPDPDDFDEWFHKMTKATEGSSGVVGVNEEAVIATLSLIADAGEEELRTLDIFNNVEMLEVPITSFFKGLAGLSKATKASSLADYGNTDLAAMITENTLKKSEGVNVMSEASKEDAVDTLMPTGAKPSDSVNGSASITHEVLRRMEEHDLIQAKINAELTSGQRVTDERMAELIEEAKDDVRKQYGKSFISDMAEKVDPDRGVKHFEFLLGKVDGTPFATEASAKQAISARFGKDHPSFEVYNDPKGGVFIKGKRDVQESFTIDENMSKGVGGLLGKIRSATSTLPQWLSGKALTAQYKRSKLISHMQPIIGDAVNLPRKEYDQVVKMMHKADAEEADWSIATFVSRFGDEFNGTKPTNQQILSYQAWRKLRDISYNMEDYNIFIDLHSKGFKSVKSVDSELGFNFKTHGPMRPIENMASTDRALFYDVESGTVKSGRSQGYGVGDVNDMISKDGTHELFKLHREYEGATYILARKGTFQVSDLQRNILNRTRGWNREYDYEYFLKTPVQRTIDGRKASLNAKTIGGAKTIQQARQMAKDINEAVQLYGKTSAADSHTIADRLGELGFEDGWDEIHELIQKGDLSLDHPIQVARKDEVIRYEGFNPLEDIDATDAKSSLHDFYDNKGSLVFSKKGKRIKTPQDELALIVDPDRTMSKVIQGALGRASIADYRTAAIGQWMSSYGRFLKESPGLTQEQILLGGLKKEHFKNIPDDLLSKAMQSGHAIRTQLRSNTEYAQHWRSAVRSIGEIWEPAAKFSNKFDLLSKDPITFMRTVAFDTKLGLFNPDQLILQINQAATIAAMDPVNAPKLYQEGFHIMLASFSPHKEVHNFVSKKFFDDPAEAQEMINAANDSGALKVGGELAMIDNAHLSFDVPNTVGGAFGWAREKGRIIFYNAEKFNRSIAFAKAWSEIRKRKPVEYMRSQNGKDELNLLTEKYSGSMTQMSQANWQKGLMSLPMQFMSYPLRVLENVMPEMFGGSTLWTGKQKGALVASHVALYGAAAVPFMKDNVFEMMVGMGLNPEENPEAYRLAMGGISDAFIAYGLGINSTQSNRAAIGTFVEDFWDKIHGEDYNQTSFLGFILGAGGQIVNDIAEDGVSALSLMIEAAASDQADLQQVTSIGLEAINQFARENIQTYSRASKMYFALKTGYDVSNRTSQKIGEVDMMQSLGMILGLRPFEMSQALLMKDMQEGRRSYIKETSATLKRLHQERLLHYEAGDIEKYRKVNQDITILQGSLDYEDRMSVLRNVYKSPTHRTFVQQQKSRFMRDIQIPQQLEELRKE